jgi:hypothetical protein
MIRAVPSSPCAPLAGDETTDLDKHAVLDLMTPLPDVVSVEPSASVSECVDIFFNKNVRHIPVRADAHALVFSSPQRLTPTSRRKADPRARPPITLRHSSLEPTAICIAESG